MVNIIADVKFLNVPQASRATRRYVIGNLDKPGNIIYTAENVKVSEELDFVLNIEYFDNYSKVNIIKVADRYYDVLAIREISRKSSVLQFTVTYNPISSLLSSGSSLYGWFERTPTKIYPSARINIATDTLKQSRFIALDDMQQIGSQNHYYVQIVSRSGASTSERSTLTMYGTFVFYFPGHPTSGEPVLMTTEDSSKTFPALSSIINDIDEKLGIAADDVVGIYVSARCPWSFKYIHSDRFDFLRYGGSVVTPEFDADGKNGKIVLNGSYCQRKPEALSTLTLTDKERYTGTVSIVSQTGNVIGVIPTEYFDRNNTLEYIWAPYADYTGVYTIVAYSDQMVIIPEGQLPWVGDSWATYAARSREFDREAMLHAIQNSREQLNQDIASAVSGAILTGTVGAASGSGPVGLVAGIAQAGMDIWTATARQQMAERDIRFQQQLLEARVKAAPSSHYQTSYGLDYMRAATVYGLKLGIRIDTPANLSDADFNQHMKQFGWPLNRLATVGLTDGYIKGQLYNMNGYGLMGERLKEEIANGCRIVIS